MQQHVKSREIPERIKDTNGQLEYLMRPYGIMRRTVRLSNGCYRDAVGATLDISEYYDEMIALSLTGEKPGVDPAKCLFFEHGYYDKLCRAMGAFTNLTPMEEG